MRRDQVTFWLAIFAAVVAAASLVLGPYLFDKVNDVTTDARTAQFEACQRSNARLRFVINRNLGRPLHDVVKIAATPSGDPAFDVFVPFYRRALEQIKAVPYAICANAYPPDGSDPHPPYFRAAALPDPIPIDEEREPREKPGSSSSSRGGGSETGGAPPGPPGPPMGGSDTGRPAASPGSSAAPPDSSGGGGAPGSSDQDGGATPGSPAPGVPPAAPPAPPTRPPEHGGLAGDVDDVLDQVTDSACDTAGALGVNPPGLCR